MLKRQETVLSSSSRRENVPENHHAKAIGCMAGILQLISKYQSRRRFLTFGKKQGKHNEEDVPPPPPSSSASKAAKVPLVGNQALASSMSNMMMRGDHNKEIGGNKVLEVRRFSCEEVPIRSPTLPAEIRRANSVNSSSPENFRNSTAAPPTPALVGRRRLMGLEENIPSADEESSSTSASASAWWEKRRKLLGALERCDEDLKAIKKIIEEAQLPSAERVIGRVVVSVEEEGNAASPGWGAIRKCSSMMMMMGGYCRNDTAASGEAGFGGGTSDHNNNNNNNNLNNKNEVKKCCTEFNCELPSPISVLDNFITTLSPPPLNSIISSSSSISKRHIITNGRMVQQQQKQKPQPKKNPKEEDIINVGFFQKNPVGSFRSKCENAVVSTSPSTSPSPSPSSSPLWSSKAMIESVEEVCGDIAWGEKREVGRIGLVLHDYICKELIEEVVKEYLGGCRIYSLPLEACTRRLRF